MVWICESLSFTMSSVTQTAVEPSDPPDQIYMHRQGL